MNILSIQSWVAYGHVGNASAVFPLQRLGAEVWSINTVQFSNHTGYGDWTGQVYTGDAVRDLVDGIAARNVLRHCDAVLSGYMGDAGIGEAILRMRSLCVRQEDPQALCRCDPVISAIVEEERLCARGHRGIPARSRSATGRHCHAQPVRIGAVDRDRLSHTQ